MSYLKHHFYDKRSLTPFKLSRSKIDLYSQCPRCFYLDRKLGIPRPSLPAFTLNSAVDTLLKKEFDLLRASGEKHALMKKYHIPAVPFRHPDLDTWRENFKGAQYLHTKTNFLVTGAIDDLWESDTTPGLLHIVDYKATSTEKEISLDDRWKEGYKKQIEIYQWIFRRNGFKVSDLGYFVFANAGRNAPKFDGRLQFELSIIEYRGDDRWVEPALLKIKKLLEHDVIPSAAKICEFCRYRDGLATYKQISIL